MSTINSEEEHFKEFVKNSIANTHNKNNNANTNNLLNPNSLIFYIDYLNLSLNFPNYANILVTDYLSFDKLLKKSLKNINTIGENMYTDKEIYNSTTFIINYYNYNNTNNTNSKSTTNIIFLKSCLITSINSVKNILIQRTFKYLCNCNSSKNITKYFNLYDISFSNRNPTIHNCYICKLSSTYDKFNDKYSECQEITVKNEFDSISNSNISIFIE